MKTLITAVVLLSCGLCWATPKGDQYINNVLKYSMPSSLVSARLEPAKLKNFTDVVETVVPGTGIGRIPANFTNGRLVGLSEVFRLGNCFGPAYVAGNISLNCTLGFSLRALYDLRTQRPILPRYPVIGNSTRSYAAVKLTSSVATQRTTVKSFEVANLNFDLGYGLLPQSITRALNRNAVQELNNLVTVQYRNVLQRAVLNARIPLP